MEKAFNVVNEVAKPPPPLLLLLLLLLLLILRFVVLRSKFSSSRRLPLWTPRRTASTNALARTRYHATLRAGATRAHVHQRQVLTNHCAWCVRVHRQFFGDESTDRLDTAGRTADSDALEERVTRHACARRAARSCVRSDIGKH
jgi:hypothetical protein